MPAGPSFARLTGPVKHGPHRRGVQTWRRPGPVRGTGARRAATPAVELLDLEGALHVGVDVTAKEVGAGGLGRNVVDDRLRAGDDLALEDLGAAFGLVDRDVVRRALLVVVGDLEGLAGRRLQRG